MPLTTCPLGRSCRSIRKQFMDAEKIRQVLGQELHDRRQIREHANVAADALRIFGQFDGDFFDVQQRDAGMVQQRFARRRQHHALGQPLEQGYAESEFEIGQPLADGGCRDAFANRRPRQVHFLAHRDEQPQRRQIDAPQQRAFGAADAARRMRRAEIDGFERHWNVPPFH